MHVAVGVYVDADVAASVDAHVGVQALFKGPDTCMANLLVHVCVPVLLHAEGTFNTYRPNVSQQ